MLSLPTKEWKTLWNDTSKDRFTILKMFGSLCTDLKREEWESSHSMSTYYVPGTMQYFMDTVIFTLFNNLWGWYDWNHGTEDTEVYRLNNLPN